MPRPTTAALRDKAQQLADDAKALYTLLANAMCHDVTTLTMHREAVAHLSHAQHAISSLKYVLNEFNQLTDADMAEAADAIAETGWKSMPRHSMDSVQGEHEVITAWADDAGDYGIGFDDVVTDVEWQKVDTDTMAYRISGKVLLVIEWDYDGAPDGAGMSILSWHMGVER